MSITQNIVKLKESLPAGVTLVAVSKFHPVEALQEAYDAGQRVFGESRAQELTAKQRVLPGDIEWHFIGPLQSNKVKDIAPFIHTIQSIDTLKLLREVDKQAARCERVIHVLLEIHVAKEEAKHGFSPDECRRLLQSGELDRLSNIQVSGLMGMATNTEDEVLIRHEFHTLYALYSELKAGYFKETGYFRELSMGMSHDYLLAIREGSTMIRIGTSLFGEREY